MMFHISILSQKRRGIATCERVSKTLTLMKTLTFMNTSLQKSKKQIKLMNRLRRKCLQITSIWKKNKPKVYIFLNRNFNKTHQKRRWYLKRRTVNFKSP